MISMSLISSVGCSVSCMNYFASNKHYVSLLNFLLFGYLALTILTATRSMGSSSQFKLVEYLCMNYSVGNVQCSSISLYCLFSILHGIYCLHMQIRNIISVLYLPEYLAMKRMPTFPSCGANYLVWTTLPWINRSPQLSYIGCMSILSAHHCQHQAVRLHFLYWLHEYLECTLLIKWSECFHLSLWLPE